MPLAAPASAVSPGELELDEAPNAVRGAYSLDEVRVTFGAERHPDGRVALAVALDAKTVEGRFEPAGSTLILDGGGAAIASAERTALQGLADGLESRWSPYAVALPLERHLAFRLILLLSEAPAGFRFERMQVALPPQPGALDRVTVEGCTNEDDDDDVYIDCAPAMGEVCFDACPAHGFLCETDLLGCDQEADCLGRCGAGCGSDGGGTYRQDCADHDACCRTHGGCLNPFDSQCGDEYFEAADDFFTDANCTDCLGCALQLRVDRSQVRPGELLTVDLLLQHDVRAARVTRVFELRLEAPDGSAVAEVRSRPFRIRPGDRVHHRELLLVPQGTAPGTYRLKVTMDGMMQGEIVRSAEVTVLPE